MSRLTCLAAAALVTLVFSPVADAQDRTRIITNQRDEGSIGRTVTTERGDGSQRVRNRTVETTETGRAISGSTTDSRTGKDSSSSGEITGERGNWSANGTITDNTTGATGSFNRSGTKTDSGYTRSGDVTRPDGATGSKTVGVVTSPDGGGTRTITKTNKDGETSTTQRSWSGKK